MRKKHLLLIQEISKNIPKNLLDNLIIEQKVSPALEKVVKDFVSGKKVAKYMEERFKGKKEQLKNLYDTGFFSKTEKVADPKIEKKIDNYLEEKIKEAVENGLLPKKLNKLMAKAKQNAKRNIRGERKAD